MDLMIDIQRLFTLIGEREVKMDSMSNQIAKMEVEIKALKDKYEPKKEDKKEVKNEGKN